MNGLFWRNSIYRRSIFVALLLSAASLRPCCAAPGDLLLHVPNPEGIVGARFGDSVSAFQGNLLVGASYTPVDYMAFVGRAYLIDSTTGEVLRTFHNPVPQTRSSFAEAILGFDDLIVIGAGGSDVGNNVGAGWVYVFGPVDANPVNAIPNPTAGIDQSSGFGSRLSANGAYFAAGVNKNANGIMNPGEVYVIAPASGDLVQPIPNPDPAYADSFARSLASFADRIVVGAFLDDAGPDGDNFGRVWVFNDSGEVQHILENPAPNDSLPPHFLSDWYGYSVATAGNRIIVGAPHDDPGGVDNAGSAYVFDGMTGELLLTIPNPFPGERFHFGDAVAGVGGDILVGANQMNVNGIEAAGAAYLFDGRTGELLREFPNPEPGAFDQFGATMTAVGNNILIGAWADDPDGLPSAGSVYLFEGFPSGDTNHDGVVNIQDLNNVRNDFGSDGPGDLNANRVVDIEDLNLVRNNFGAGSSIVPEPGTGALFVVCVAHWQTSIAVFRCSSTSNRRKRYVHGTHESESS